MIRRQALPNTPYLPSSEEGASRAGEPTGPPFTVYDVVEVSSLSEVLGQLVFDHPEVKQLQPAAIVASKEARWIYDETAGLVGAVIGLEEPVIPIRHVSHQKRRKKEKEEFAARIATLEPNEFYRPHPPALASYYGAINARIGLLFEFLQERQLIGFGHTKDGHLVPLAHTIWSHEDFYVHRYDGDVYEAGPEILEKVWTGVMLAMPNAQPTDGMSHVKATVPDPLRWSTTETETSPDHPGNLNRIRPGSSVSRKRPVADEIEAALEKHGINSDPGTLGWKEIAAFVAPSLKRAPATELEWQALSKAIQRHYKRRER